MVIGIDKNSCNNSKYWNKNAYLKNKNTKSDNLYNL